MKLIFVVTEDWYFWSHRLPMARAAKAAGLEVGVATRVKSHSAAIISEGFTLHSLDWDRSSLSPFAAIRTIISLVHLFRRERPDIVHNVALKAVVLGGVAAMLARVPRVINALTGLGYLFTSTGWKVVVARALLSPLLKVILTRHASILLLQNKDNQERLRQLGLTNRCTIIIRGSGVDTERFKPFDVKASDKEDKEIVVAFVGRLIATKGLRVLIEAHRLLLDRQVTYRLSVVGDVDPHNPDAISSGELDQWRQEPHIEWWGHCNDVRDVWERADIAVLPSTIGEGLPKSLLEAAACGRPIVASDVSGCREICVPGTNGFLVPPHNPARLADAIQKLCESKELREIYGRHSRRLVETDMSEVKVFDETVALYRRLIASLS